MENMFNKSFFATNAQKAARSRKIRSSAIGNDLRSENLLASEINKLYKKINKEIMFILNNELKDSFKQDALERNTYRILSLLGVNIKKWVEEIPLLATAQQVEEYHGNKFRKQLNSLAGIQIRELKQSSKIQSFVEYNLSKISEDLEEYKDVLAGIINNSHGIATEEVAAMIKKHTDISGRKAELLARDQVATLLGEINKERQNDLGITQFEWMSSNDERVRETHAELANKVYSWVDLPTINGTPVYPRAPVIECINCRCECIPYMPFFD